MSAFSRIHLFAVADDVDSSAAERLAQALAPNRPAAVIASANGRVRAFAERWVALHGGRAVIADELERATDLAELAVLVRATLSEFGGAVVALVADARTARRLLAATLGLDDERALDEGASDRLHALLEWPGSADPDARPSLVALDPDWNVPFDPNRDVFPGAIRRVDRS